MTPTDKNYLLLKSLQKQDENALKQLYNQYWKKMYIYALKILKDQQLCEDIIQEIFISVWEKAPSTKIKNIEYYLFKALKYRIVNAIRDNKYIYMKGEHLSLIPPDESAKNMLEYNELESQVHKKIQSLPEKCRNVFYLSRIENYSNGEIAEELNISIRTVETHISKALKYLRFHLPSFLPLLYFLKNSFLLSV